MRNGAAHLAVWLNSVADFLGRLLLAPIGSLPGWLSATAIAVATGVVSLGVFKHTSNQDAIKRVRDDIDANLLALKLFNDTHGLHLWLRAASYAAPAGCSSSR